MSLAFSDAERHAIGQKLGDSIRLQIEVIAALEKIEPSEVFEQIIETYIAERIIATKEAS